MKNQQQKLLQEFKWIFCLYLFVSILIIPLNSIAQDRSKHKHSNGKEKCFICDKSLRQKGRLWCKEHSRYEDRCWICHPDMQDKKRAYCKEHSLYEDECIFCNKGKKTETRSKPHSQSEPTLFCNEHKVFEHECGICQPMLASELEPGQSMKVRFISKDSAGKAGVNTSLPEEMLLSPTIKAFCEVDFNGNKLAHITPLVPGIVRKVLIDVGSKVKAGDILVEINSAEIAAAKAEYLSAIADHHVKNITSEREEKLVKQKISARREFEEADALTKMALLKKHTTHQKLLNFGFTEKEIAQIEKEQDSSSLLSIRAPYDGTVVSREAVVGEFVEPGKEIFKLANLSKMWLELSIPTDNVAFIESGLTVQATFNKLPGVTVKGKLTWVYASIDERSRMLKARAIVPNIDEKLKEGMFGEAKIEIGEKAKALHVSNNAIQHFENKPYLFVKVEEDLYDLRRISLGSKANSKIEVIKGIKPEEQIVVSGTFTVMSEFLKSRLGAGCVDD